ncbi:MAG TPA: BTAD domain-containing putative transcriptional regulator [Gemmatimonadaceae bacterium]
MAIPPGAARPQGPTHFRLLTLGRLALAGAGGETDESLQKRRRKLAVLAWLALEARPRSRDAAVEMFWGEQEEARARHALSDAISHLRRVLGRSAIVADRAELSIARGAPLTVDACELLRASEAGDDARVIALHGGPFLDGVYVEGSASFEHWVTQQRARLEGCFVRACAARCAALAAGGAWGECAAVAGRWLDADPLSTEAALARLRAIAAPGSTDAALAAIAECERLEARLAREFEVKPAREVREYVDLLRAKARATPAGMPVWREAAAAPAAPSRATPLRLDAVAPSSRGAPPTRDRASRSSGPHGTMLTRWRPRPRHIAATTLAALLVVAALLVPPLRPSTAVSPSRVAVFPFAVRAAGTGSDAAWLREGLASLLASSLDGAGSLRSTDPRAVLGAVARQHDSLDTGLARGIALGLGAGLFVTGEVVEAGGALQVSAALYDASRDDPLARATVSGTGDSLFAMADLLTAQLLAQRPAGPAEQLQRVAAVTTPSLPALKAYLQGEEQYRTGRYAAAYESFQHALADDSAFALAHYRLAKTATWAGIWSWDSIVVGSGRAVRHERRLARRQRLLVEAFDAWMRGDADGAEWRYRQVVASWPDDVEAWYELGEVLFHGNPLRGRPAGEAREAFERTLALEPDHRGALVHLLRISAQEHRATERDSLVARALAVSGEDWGIELRAFRAHARGDARESARADSVLHGAQDAILERTAERVALYAGDWAGAARLARMMTEPARAPELRVRGALWLADLAIARGRFRDAEAPLAEADRIWPVHPLLERARLATLPWAPVGRHELQRLRDALRRWDGEGPAGQWPPLQVYAGLYPVLREYLIGMVSVRLADSSAADRSAASLVTRAAVARGAGPARAQEAELARGLGESLRAHLAAAEGRREEALQRLERSRIVVSEGLLESAIGAQGHERWARAELLREAGRLREALGWYRSLAEVGLHGQVWLAPAELRQGEIEQRLGDRTRAAAHYRRALAAWRDADPELAARVSEAKRSLASLGERRP